MEKEYKATQYPDDGLQKKPDWQAMISEAGKDGWIVRRHPIYGWILERYIGPGPEAVVPGWIASICEDAFKGRTDLTGITLQGKLKFIDRYAFSGCTGLTSVTIPESVTEIRYDAFYNCTGLAEIKVDAENKHYRAVDGLLLELRREWESDEGGGAEDFHGPGVVKPGVYEEEDGDEDSSVRGDVTSERREEDVFALSGMNPGAYEDGEDEDWEDENWESYKKYCVLRSCPPGKD